MPESRPWDYDSEVEAEFGAGDTSLEGTRYGGSEAGLRAATPDDAESLWEKARAAVGGLFGSPDRAEARAAGIGLQPTPAEMVQGLAQPAGMATLAAAGMGEVPMALGALSRGAFGAAAKASPLTAATVGSSAGGWAGGKIAGPQGAAVGSLVGGLAGGRLAAPAAAAESVAVAEGQAVAKAAAKAAKGQGVKSVPKVAEEVAASIAPKPLDLMAFARQAGTSTKKGERIWILLEKGRPVKVLTPDQAGAATRAGKQTTWVKNLWGSE